jgi:hypothetical protein
LFFISLKAGGGTHYKASYVLFWTLVEPFAEKQGIGRALVLDS